MMIIFSCFFVYFNCNVVLSPLSPNVLPLNLSHIKIQFYFWFIFCLVKLFPWSQMECPGKSILKWRLECRSFIRSALGINNCRKGRKWDWTEREIGLLAEQSQCFSSLLKGTLKRGFLISYTLESKCFTYPSHILATSCSTSIIGVMLSTEQIDIGWCFERCPATQFSSDYFMTEVSRVNIALGQGCKCIVSFPRECELFLFSFPIGMEKNAFARSKVVYHVPEALLICSSNNTTLQLD